MATIMSSISTIVPATVTVTNAKKSRTRKVVYMNGLSSYGGLKAHNTVVGLGTPLGTEQCFAKLVGSLRPKSGGRGGGALSTTCNAAVEIFRIASIMNGLVLVGVAVGFVLLRIEASLEEAE